MSGSKYSFSLTTFSPSGELVQIKHALAAITAGATSLGIKATNGVVLRLRLRFTEAIKEAQEMCEIDKNSSECHWAWYEVDELEDAILRLYPDRQ